MKKVDKPQNRASRRLLNLQSTDTLRIIKSKSSQFTFKEDNYVKTLAKVIGRENTSHWSVCKAQNIELPSCFLGIKRSNGLDTKTNIDGYQKEQLSIEKEKLI